MIQIAVCDDNMITLHNLSRIIYDAFSSHFEEVDVRHYTSGRLLLNACKQISFDVIFLDIDMPQINGFEVAKNLRDTFSNCFLIFVTSHAELVYDSMDFQPFHFIRKDDHVSIQENINRIVGILVKHMKQNYKIVLDDPQSGKQIVYAHDIVYIESDKHYRNYYITNKREPIRERGSMKECEEMYSKLDFVKIHKCYLVNLRYLIDVDNRKNEVILREAGIRLTMSRNYKRDVNERYMLYLRSLL